MLVEGSKVPKILRGVKRLPRALKGLSIRMDFYPYRREKKCVDAPGRGPALCTRVRARVMACTRARTRAYACDGLHTRVRARVCVLCGLRLSACALGVSVLGVSALV